MAHKRVIIVHGYGGDPARNWFPWLNGKLGLEGVEVLTPRMPDPENPDREEWVNTLYRLIDNPDENTYFVGHSLGCITILRYLETLPETTRLGGLVLAAGFTGPLATHTQLDAFVGEWLNYAKCARIAAPHIVAINSDDDPYVPLEEGEIMKEKLGAKLVVYPNGGHLNDKSGLTEFPLLLEALQNLMKS